MVDAASSVIDSIPATETLVRRASDLVESLKARAKETENLRRLPDVTVEDLHNGGFLKILQPKQFGGFELDWGSQIRVGAELARGCGSTAWIQSVVGAHAWLAGRLSPEVQAEIFEQPDVMIATAFAGGREIKVVPTAGGHRLSGVWKFASGVDHAQWAIVGTQAHNGDNDNYEMLLYAIPRGEYSIVDDWFVSGLRGTGSKDIAVDELFVPTYRTTPLNSISGGMPPGAGPHESYIYRVEMNPYFATNVLGPIVGSAKGALESYLEVTRSRIGQIFGERIAEQVPVQTRIAESASEIAAAELLLDRIISELHRRGVEGQTIPKGERVRQRRDAAFIGRLCDSATNRLASMMGASGLTDDNPVQRFFRDTRAMNSHHSQQWDHCAAPFGRWALGLATGDAVIDSAREGPSVLF